jgi:hypothetical protein
LEPAKNKLVLSTVEWSQFNAFYNSRQQEKEKNYSQHPLNNLIKGKSVAKNISHLWLYFPLL